MLRSDNPLDKNVLCSKCLNTINDFHEFRRTIYEVHETLTSAVNSKHLNLVYSIEEFVIKEEQTEDGQICDDLNEENTFNLDDSDDCESSSSKASSILVPINTKKSSLNIDNQIENTAEFSLNKEEEMDNLIAQAMPEIKCQQCKQLFNKFSLLRRHFKQEHPKLQFYVICCKRKFYIRSSLANHIRLHIDPDLYQCDICGERKTCKRYLDNHKRIMHEHFTINYDSDYESNTTKKTGLPTENSKESRLEKKEEMENLIAEQMPEINCHACQQYFNRYSLFQNHFKERHPGLQFYIICCEKKLFHRSSLAQHLRLHINPDLYKCNTCGERKTCKRGLENHKRHVHENLGPSYECELCQKTFFQERSYKSHLYKHNTSISKDIPCPHCPRHYAFEKQLQRHIKTTHNFPTNVVCEHCGETMYNRYYMRKHAVMHGLIKATPRKTYKCDICNKTLQGMDSLKKHYASMHNDGTTEFICGECGKVSYSKEALLSHKANVHRTQRNFKCTVCAKAFRKARDVKMHMVTHTKEKLHKCEDCDKAFTRLSSKFQHRRNAHPEEYEKNRKSTPRIKVDRKNIEKQVVL